MFASTTIVMRSLSAFTPEGLAHPPAEMVAPSRSAKQIERGKMPGIAAGIGSVLAGREHVVAQL